MKKRLTNYFMAGLLLVVPVAITFFAIRFIVLSMDKMLVNPLMTKYLASLPFDITASDLPPGTGLILTIVTIIIIGFLGTNFLGKKLIHVGEWIVEKIPVIRSIYHASKTFLETIIKQDGENFNRVVLVEYPRKGIYSIGFVTGKTKEELHEVIPVDTVNVFIPTTPNPTSGFYLAIPETDVRPLSMDVEDAFKVIMTGGIVVPEFDRSKATSGKATSGAGIKGSNAAVKEDSTDNNPST